MPTENKGSRLVSKTFGILVGFSGLEHGLFEIAQGNNPTSGLFIQAIGSAQRMWSHGGEPAITIIPNYLFSGILASVFGIAIILWSLYFIDKKQGGAGLFVLSVIQLLVGGGIMPIFLAACASVTAYAINNPMNWLRTHSPRNVISFTSKLFPYSYVLFLFIYFVALEIAIVGYVPAGLDPYRTLWMTAYSMLAVFVFTAIAGITYDMNNINTRAE